MSAPGNDNFVNAKSIPALPYVDAGSTVDSTAEAGEPLNFGNTVWYEVQAGWSGSKILTASLRLNDALPQFNVSIFDIQSAFNDINVGPYLKNYTNFPARIQVFTSSNGTLANLVEVPYVVDWSGGFQNSGNEAVVTFDIQGSPKSYYIRVSSRSSGVVGNYLLSVFYGCACCCGCLAGKTLLAKSTPGVLGENVASFGDFPAGEYTINYCCGAFTHTGAPDWTVYHWSGPYADDNPGAKITVDYMLAGVLTTAFLNPVNGLQEYNTQNQAEVDVRALNPSVTIQHSGGPIGMHIHDSPFSDNANGSPNPTFGLWGPASASSLGCVNLTLGTPVSDCSAVGSFIMQVPVTNNGTKWQSGILTISNPVGFTPANTSAHFYVMPGKTIYVPFFLSVATLATQVSGTVMLTDIANTVQCGTANFNFTWPRYNITYTGRSAFTAAAGGDCAVTFGIRLNSQFCTLTGCKVELKLTGGIIKTTGPILGAILKPGDNNFTFNFRAAITGSPITFTVVVSDQFGNQIFTFNDSTATAMSLTAAAGTTVTRSGDTLTISFKASFSNPCCPLQGCAIVLNGTGGVTAPAPLTNVTLANGLNTFNFVFNTSIANKVDIIATLAVYDNQLNLLGTLAYDLKPVLLVTMNWQVGASGPGHPCGSCTGASDTDAGFDIKNIGLGPTVALKLPGVVCGCFGNLGVGINWPSPQGQPLVIGILLPGATIQAGNFAHVARFSGHGPFTITFLDGTYNFPNFITPVTP